MAFILTEMMVTKRLEETA